MPGSLVATLAGIFLGLIPLAIFLYAAYWAFVIRHALVVRIYRNHALALGLMSVVIAVQLIPVSLPNDSILFDLILVALFAFVDSTIPIARRSDPLLRPILRWGAIRIYAWIVLLASLAAWVLFDYGGFPPWALINVLLPIVVGGPALLIGSRRSGDLLFSRSLKWIGFAILFFGAGVIAFLVSSIWISPYDFSGSYFAIPSGVFLALSAYSFYKSVRSLAPVNRLEAFEVVAPLTTDVTLGHDYNTGRY